MVEKSTLRPDPTHLQNSVLSQVDAFMNDMQIYSLRLIDPFIQRIKKQYKDARNQRNLSKLNEDLHDVTRIMTRNIQDILGRQEALNGIWVFITRCWLLCTNSNSVRL